MPVTDHTPYYAPALHLCLGLGSAPHATQRKSNTRHRNLHIRPLVINSELRISRIRIRSHYSVRIWIYFSGGPEFKKKLLYGTYKDFSPWGWGNIFLRKALDIICYIPKKG